MVRGSIPDTGIEVKTTTQESGQTKVSSSASWFVGWDTFTARYINTVYHKVVPLSDVPKMSPCNSYRWRLGARMGTERRGKRSDVVSSKLHLYLLTESDSCIRSFIYQKPYQNMSQEVPNLKILRLCKLENVTFSKEPYLSFSCFLHVYVFSRIQVQFSGLNPLCQFCERVLNDRILLLFNHKEY